MKWEYTQLRFVPRGKSWTGEIEELWLDDRQIISRSHPQRDVTLVGLMNELGSRLATQHICPALHRLPRWLLHLQTPEISLLPSFSVDQSFCRHTLRCSRAITRSRQFTQRLPLQAR